MPAVRDRIAVGTISSEIERISSPKRRQLAASRAPPGPKISIGSHEMALSSEKLDDPGPCELLAGPAVYQQP